MAWGFLTFRERAMLYAALRDIEEVAFKVSERVKPEWRRIVANITTTDDGRTWLRVYGAPTYMSVADVLFSIRDLLRLVIEIDNEEKVKIINKWWTPMEGENE